MRSSFIPGLLILSSCAASGCWREVEYTAPEPTDNTEQQAPSLVDQVASKADPSPPVTPTDSKAADESKTAASEFGDDLAAKLSTDAPTSQAGEPTATTPIAGPSTPSAPNVGDRYAVTTPVETPSNAAESGAAPPDANSFESLLSEPVDPNAPPDSPVNDSMLPEQREAIAEMSDVPIPNLNDDEIQTPPAVEAWNSRRAAWLLGSKLSLAALANEHGAPAAEVQKLFGQSSALAKKLDIAVKELPARPAAGAARSEKDSAIDYLFAEGQEIGSELALRQGADRAALFEVAVKSNILLVIYKPDAPTTQAIAAAIERAGERAKLPATLLQPLLDTLAAKATLVDVRKAVYELHGATDKYLDETAPR